MANKNNKDTKSAAAEAVQGKDGVLHVGQATAEQLESWKKQYAELGDVQCIKVKVSDKEMSYGYLKPPGREHMSRAMTFYMEKKLLQAGEFIVNNLWLGGDERQRTHARISVAAAMYANGMIEFMEGELVNV